MSRMTTSLASLDWARLAMRRACSSGFSRFGLPRRIAASLAVVQAGVGDRMLDRRRDEAFDRLAPSDPLAHLAGGDIHRLDLEEDDAVRSCEPCEHGFELSARIARPRRDTEPGELEHGVRLLPAQEIGELVGTDEEDRVGVRAVAQEIDRAGVVIELDVIAGKGGAGEREAVGRTCVDTLVARVGDDEHDDPLGVEALPRLLDQGDMTQMGWIERAAEQSSHAAVTNIRTPRLRRRP